MISERKTANAVGGKTARACDSCVRRRAKWYCAADDAFLCQTCDGSVHSANQLASRHERVRLETSSFKVSSGSNNEPERTWHQGFTRKARTPRMRTKSNSLKVKNQENTNPFMPLVPEIGMEDVSLLNDDDEEKLLYRVPIFDPFAAELCSASNHEMETNETFVMENKQEQECKLDDLQGFDLPSDDLELLEFAADVESLLGHGLDEESCGIEGLGFTKDCKEEDGGNKLGFCFEENRMKVKDEEEVEGLLGCDWDFDYEPKMMMMIEEEEEEDDEKEVIMEVEKKMMVASEEECKELGLMRRPSSIVLRLNYEKVIDAWADQGSPWTNGIRPEFNPDDCWPDFMGVHIHSRANNRAYGGGGSSDGGREARVSRYREKRRNRLFSKKIRYEVRKLNAEKRPRMKGRFVKREAINGGPHGPSNFPHYLTKK